MLKQYEEEGTVAQKKLTEYRALLMQMVPWEHKHLYLQE